MMKNLMGGGRQGFYQDDDSRLGIGAAGGPFPTSLSSPTAAAAAASSSLEQGHHQIGFPSSYYSYQQPPPRGPTLTDPCPGRDTETMRCYGRGGGGGGNYSTSQLRDHLMMISMDGGSSSSPTTTTTSTSNNNNSIISDQDAADHHHHHEGSSVGGGGNGATAVSIEREHMFDKVVTPSDVGKLNRLVIPKQHAEKYFPLDSSTNEKGLLLNFEDRNGKPWRFRYSYWNSSQSYVMTKGWSRFVKEKKLDAGDIVSFQRGLGELGKDRLFIDWRRRPDAPSPPPRLPPLYHHHHHPSFITPTLSVPSSDPQYHDSHHHHQQYSFHYPSWNHPYYLHQHPPSSSRDQYYSHFQQYSYENSSRGGGGGYGSGYGGRNPCSGSIIYLNRSPTAAGGGGGGGAAAARVGGTGGVGLMGSGGSSQLMRGVIHHHHHNHHHAEEDEDGDEAAAMVFESVPVVQGKAAAKRLRLFGVNMDCPISREEDQYSHHHPEILMDQCDILSSTAVPLPSAATVLMASHSSSVSPLMIRPYNNNVSSDVNNSINGTPMLLPSSTTHDLLNKGKAASMSLDLDI